VTLPGLSGEVASGSIAASGCAALAERRPHMHPIGRPWAPSVAAHGCRPVEQVSCASPMLSLAVADMQEPGATQLILTAQARR